jgi:hypothetical protein
MAQRVRGDALVDAGALSREPHGVPDRFVVIGVSARQPFRVPGKRYVSGRIQR